VLHKHPEDLQAGLANYNDIVLNESHLKYGGTDGGQSGWSWGKRGNIHNFFDSGDWRYFGSLGKNFYYDIFDEDYPNWILDIDDDVRYLGADPGKRPLYYHCYKYGDYYYLQYWYFFTMNDIRSQHVFATWHEGDWEHVALKIKNQNGVYVPVDVNFYNHSGGYSVAPSQTWWSATVGRTSYMNIKKGYDEEHTHLHIWIAKNSHASYNRFDDRYLLTINLPDLLAEDDKYLDLPDYATPQLLFEYDVLLNMGEVYRSPKSELYPEFDLAHKKLWEKHYFHKAHQQSPQFEGLAFIGRIGEYWEHYTGIRNTTSPKSPYFGEEHEWLTFYEKDRWSYKHNESYLSYGGTVSWAEYIIPRTWTLKDITSSIEVADSVRSNTRGYVARDTIIGTGIVQYDVNTKIGANIVFAAGKSIHLKPGFHAQRGSTFHAYIDENLKE